MLMEEKTKEYDYLRSEIVQKIELHNTLLTFTITTTVAILTFALTQDSSILYLLPFCIIVPMSMRMAYYKSAIAKLSAYMIVFLESSIDGLNWETRNAFLISNHLAKKKKLTFEKFLTLRYYEFLLLSIVCYTFYVLDYIKGKSLNTSTLVFAVLPFILVLLEIIITLRINSTDKERQIWITKWSTLKEESSYCK